MRERLRHGIAARARRHWRLLAAAVVLGAAAAAAAAATGPGPQAVVEETTEEVLALMESRGEELTGDPVALHEALAPILTPHIDFQGISVQILGPYWRRADEATRERFIREFQRSLLRTYASSLEEYDGGVALRILGSRRRGDEVQVGMEVGGGEAPARVIFQLHERGGAWQLIDLTVEGVSIVHNFREDFRARLRDKDLEAVLDEMAARNREIGFQ